MLFDSAGKDTLTLGAQPPEPGPRGPGAAPRLELLAGSRRGTLGENLLVLLRGPAAPRRFRGGPYFRDCWTSGPLPLSGFLTALLCHFAIVLLLARYGRWVVYRPQAVVPPVEITWYAPVHDLPVILPAKPVPKTKPRSQPPTREAKTGAQAFHPRQTILNRPLRPNHPRQTLIQPDTPPEPPKILPSLPNIVSWNQSSQPELLLAPNLLLPVRPKAFAARQRDVATPEIPNQQKLVGAVSIAALNDKDQKPALPIAPMSAPRARTVRLAAEPPPNLQESQTAGANARQLIALSATPGPAMPPVVPPGNLSSRLSISPEGPSSGSPPSSRSSKGSAAPNGPAKGVGPPGLSIAGGKPAGLIVSGVGPGSPARHVMPGIAAAVPARSPMAPSVHAESSPLAAGLKSRAPAEALLGGGHIYTLHINMPNLTSASGSWILSFSELAPDEEMPNAYTNPANLQAPEPLRKVDPKYPPALRDHHIQGEVVLYAVIRQDGSVDSIQLVQGIDPTLNNDAMKALAQWKFRPAERNGHPVALQAVVRIPFRAGAPLY